LEEHILTVFEELVVNLESSHSLLLQGEDRWGCVNWSLEVGEVDSLVIFTLPFVVPNLLSFGIELVVGKIHLLDADHWCFGSAIRGIEEIKSELLDVNIQHGRVEVKLILNVLESNEDLVLGQWENYVLTALEIIKFHESLWRWLNTGIISVIESEEVLEWLIDDKLLLSLKRLGGLSIKDLYPVSGIDFEAKSFAVSLIEWLGDALVVVDDESSVLDELDSTIDKSSRSTLRFLVHNGDLSHVWTGVVVEVSHGNGGVYWIVVGGDVLVGVRKVELWSMILNSRLHFKTVGVGVENSLALRILVGKGSTILSVKELPVDGNIFSLVIMHDWDTIEFKIELDEATLVWGHSNSKNSFVGVDVIFSGWCVKNEFLLSQDFACESA